MGFEGDTWGREGSVQTHLRQASKALACSLLSWSLVLAQEWEAKGPASFQSFPEVPRNLVRATDQHTRQPVGSQPRLMALRGHLHLSPPSCLWARPPPLLIPSSPRLACCQQGCTGGATSARLPQTHMLGPGSPGLAIPEEAQAPTERHLPLSCLFTVF